MTEEQYKEVLERDAILTLRLFKSKIKWIMLQGLYPLKSVFAIPRFNRHFRFMIKAINENRGKNKKDFAIRQLIIYLSKGNYDL